MAESGIAWRDSARPARVMGIDARLLVMMFVLVFFPYLVTLAAFLVAVIGFRVAEARGYRVRAAVRGVRAMLAGRRYALHLEHYRRFVGS